MNQSSNDPKKERPEEQDHNANMDEHVLHRYTTAIAYYWSASRTNKKWYKVTRALTVILGALVTLIASLTSSTTISNIAGFDLGPLFSIGTPVLAAALTVVAGFSQSFQWGSTWQNMILTAQQLEKERDRYMLTPMSERNFKDEAEILNTFVINESVGFFDRMLGGGKLPGATLDNGKSEDAE